MFFGEVQLSDPELSAAEGALLAHSVTLAGKRVAKGTRLTSELIATARSEGLTTLWVARPGADDMAEAEAASRIGAALAGSGVEARPPVHGRVNLHALHDGLFTLDAQGIAKANAISEALGIATLPPDTPVRAGDLVATVKIIPFAIAAGECGAILQCRPSIGVLPWRIPGPALLLQTLLPDTPSKLMAKTAAVTRDRLARLGWPMAEGVCVPHGVAPLASALAAARSRHGLILVAGATATADRRDVIPAAIEAAGGQVSRVGMPVDPGNLLVLGGFLQGPVVIGLPGCARSPKRNGLDLVLERLAAGLPVSSSGIAEMGVGGLLEGSGATVPWAFR